MAAETVAFTGLSDTEMQKLRDWMRDCWPQEGCGVVINRKFIGCKNIADDPVRSYRIAQQSIIDLQDRYGSRIEAIIHSHPDGWAAPSGLDMDRQFWWGIPFGIVVSHESGCEPLVWFGKHVPRPPLLERGFRHGVTDCKSLIDDWFREERGIELLDHPRDWEWWLDGEDLYSKYFAKAGFRQIQESELSAGDCVLFAIRSSVPNHAAVYLGNEKIIHHPSGRKPVDPSMLSRVDHYQRWRAHAVRWARHGG